MLEYGKTPKIMALKLPRRLISGEGLEYDHSFSHHDAIPYWLRVGDEWTKIDYSKHPDTWMKPLVRGEETGLVEIPASWYLDDLPPMVSETE